MELVWEKYTQDQTTYIKNKITHKEIHPSAILSVMANQVIFPSNNQFPRDLFSCGQSKQAVSLYHSNFNNRIDKFGLLSCSLENFTDLIWSRNISKDGRRILQSSNVLEVLRKI